MKYRVKRFSYDLIEGVNKGGEYIGAQVNSGLESIHDITSDIAKNEKLKNLKPVKRYVRALRDLSYLLKRKKNKDKLDKG